MKSILILLFLCSLAIAQQYTTKYDNVDLDQILRSDRLLKNYVNCLLEKGKCSPDGLELKSNLGDALQTNCAKCSDKQKAGSRKMIQYLIKNKADWWKDLEAKYDPEGIYRKEHAEELKNL